VTCYHIHLFWKVCSCIVWDVCLVGNSLFVSFIPVCPFFSWSILGILFEMVVWWDIVLLCLLPLVHFDVFICIFYLSLTVCFLACLDDELLFVCCCIDVLFPCSILWNACMVGYCCFNLFPLVHFKRMFATCISFHSILCVLSMFWGVSSYAICNICFIDGILFASFNLSFHYCGVFFLPYCSRVKKLKLATSLTSFKRLLFKFIGWWIQMIILNHFASYFKLYTTIGKLITKPFLHTLLSKCLYLDKILVSMCTSFVPLLCTAV